MDTSDKWAVYIGGGATLIIILVVILLPFIKWEISEDLVSGIVYDNTNNQMISGNTSFKIRAASEMATNEKTSRTYCLPPNSPYIDLVKRAAADKSLRVVVKTDKVFTLKWPWECVPNVTVEEEK